MVDLATSAHLDVPLQVVAPDGSARPAPGFDPTVLDGRLPDLCRTMVVTRGLDEELVNLQRQGELALFASCRGQEAAQIGSASALRDTDWMFPPYRAIGSFPVPGLA